MKGVLLEVVVTFLEGTVENHRFFNDVAGPIQIGSATTCHVCVPLPNVHAVHAEVVVRSSSLYVVDRSNGNLFIEGGGPVPQVELPYQRRVSLALRGTGVRLYLTSGLVDGSRGMRPLLVKVAQPVREIDESIPDVEGPRGAIDATLLAQGFREEYVLRDEEMATIGRTRACRIRVPEEVEGVSRTHAHLTWHNGWLVLEDLGSTNGTWINNQRIKRVVLRSPAHHHVELGRPGASLSVRVVRGRARRATFATPPAMAPSRDESPEFKVADATGVADKLAGKSELTTDAARLADELETQRRQLDQQRQLLDTLETRRVAAEAEWERQWIQIDAERRALQQERRQLDEERRRRPFADGEDTDPTLTALVEVDEALEWLTALPEPDRDVFRHLATHGLVNEEEATRILGGPRRFRQFSLRLEAHLAHCPFRVRIETAGKVKCYVRED